MCCWYCFLLEPQARHICYYAWGYSLLILSYMMECRTVSQICGRLYLPIFLFQIGLFTLMYIAYFMVLSYNFLAVHCCMASSALMFKYRWMCFWIILFLTPKVLNNSPTYSSSHSSLSHLNQYMTLHSSVIMSLSLWDKEIFQGLFSIKMNLYSILVTDGLVTLTQSLWVWKYYVTLLSGSRVWWIVPLGGRFLLFSCLLFIYCPCRILASHPDPL